MLKYFGSLLLVTILFTGSYVWYTATATCPIPVVYRLGMVDREFGLSEADALAAISAAEAVWEDATGLNLFSYEAESPFVINFTYDERQQLTETQEALNNRLDRVEKTTAQIDAELDRLVSEYDEREPRYVERDRAHEVALQAYNTEVDEWNAKGGAPQGVFEDLNARKELLDTEQIVLNEERVSLNELVAEINDLRQQANELVAVYNRGAEQFNEVFAESPDFTQGDYQGDAINIYQFTDEEELILVLAHELGHALDITHVEGTQSIMHFKMLEQDISKGLTEEDLAGFAAVCGDGSLFSRL